MSMSDISMEALLLVGSILIFASIVISRTGYRFGIPTLLMFLIAGMLFGTDGVGVQFDDVRVAQNIGMIALCIILFSGGMETKISDIRPVVGPGVMLSTLGVFLTTVITGAFVYGLSRWQHNTEIEFSILGSMLLAATMSSTDSASVFNILRSQRINLKYNLKPMLELESGSNDPMAYLLTILLIQCLQAGDVTAGDVALSFTLQFAVGIAGGYVMGRAATWVINHINLRNSELYSIMVLCFIFITYCVVYIFDGNGYLAVYIAGMLIGNTRLFKKREISTFLSGMTWLLQVVMFVMLGLLVNPHEMLTVTLSAVLISLFMMLVARPLSVWISLLPFGKRITTKSKMFISWVGLRGAAPILFATYPVVSEVDGANQIFTIVFIVTLISLVFQGMSLPWAARKLELTEPYQETGNTFGIEIPDDLGSTLREWVCTPEMLRKGEHVRDLALPAGILIMMVRRGKRYIVPNGNVKLREGDVLLLIADSEKSGEI